MSRRKVKLLLASVVVCAVTMQTHHAVNPRSEVNHSGGTDKCGCHFNRKTGEYHCHKRKKRGGDCPA